MGQSPFSSDYFRMLKRRKQDQNYRFATTQPAADTRGKYIRKYTADRYEKENPDEYPRDERKLNPRIYENIAMNTALDNMEKQAKNKQKKGQSIYKENPWTPNRSDDAKRYINQRKKTMNRT